jgi:hypothetical protein
MFLHGQRKNINGLFRQQARAVCAVYFSQLTYTAGAWKSATPPIGDVRGRALTEKLFSNQTFAAVRHWRFGSVDVIRKSPAPVRGAPPDGITGNHAADLSTS